MTNQTANNFTLPFSALEKGGLLRGMKRVATVAYNNGELKFEWCINEKERKSQTARLYAFVAILGTMVYYEVIKYGGSVQGGSAPGIEGTLKWYEDGCSGRPDDKGRTVGVPLALIAAIELGYEVEVWMRSAPAAWVLVEGIYEDVEREISGYKEIEDLFVSQYIILKGMPPLLNVQEAGGRHPEEVRAYVDYYLHNDDLTIYTEEQRCILKKKKDDAITAYKKKLQMSRQFNQWKSGGLGEFGEQLTGLEKELLTEFSKGPSQRNRKWKGFGIETAKRWVEECIVAQFINQSLEDCLNGKRKFNIIKRESAQAIWDEVERWMKENKISG